MISYPKQFNVRYDKEPFSHMTGASTHKGANEITLQKDFESFSVFFNFSYERILDEIFCNLLNTYSCPIDHIFCVNHC
jgi:hypothetical protein